MFPLGSVLVPGMALPLHIFEPRYQTLLADCLAADHSFGVVLIERGAEVGGGDERFSIGTLARIERHRALGGGHHALIAHGTARIRVTEWLADDPYPRARTELWPDPTEPVDVGLAAAYRRVVADLRRLLAHATERGAAVPPATFDAPDDPTVGSHLLSALAPVGPLDRQNLLEAATTSARLDALDALIADQLALFEET